METTASCVQMFDICSVCVSPVEFKEPQIDALQKTMCETHSFKAVRFRKTTASAAPTLW